MKEWMAATVPWSKLPHMIEWMAKTDPPKETSTFARLNAATTLLFK